MACRGAAWRDKSGYYRDSWQLGAARRGENGHECEYSGENNAGRADKQVLMTKIQSHKHCSAHVSALPMNAAGHRAARTTSRRSKRAQKPVVVYANERSAGRSAAKGARRGHRTLAQALGIKVVPVIRNGKSVTERELKAAMAAIRKLPPEDIALIARNNITVYLEPTSGLEGGLLGATEIVQDNASSPWRPTKIRIAAQAGLTGPQAIGEIVQHEIGHAVAVLRTQDRSEDAAIAYARRF